MSRNQKNFLNNGNGINIASFIERFKGKYQLMDKEGHFGVVKKSQVPIEKSEQILIIDNEERSKTEQKVQRNQRLAPHLQE